MGLRRREWALSSTVRRRSPYGSGGSGGIGSGGLPITVGLQTWLRADAGTYQDASLTNPAVADGDVVGGWQDMGGIGGSPTQSTGSRKPVLILGAQNGLPCVRFDGVNDYMSLTFPFGVSQPCTYYLVAKMASTTGVFFSSSAETDPTRQRFMKFTGPVWLYSAGSNISGGTPDTNLHQLSMAFAGASSVLYVDGTSTLTGNPSSGSQAGLTLGSSAAGGSLLASLDLMEFIMYRTSHAAEERAILQNYLKAKWGTP